MKHLGTIVLSFSALVLLRCNPLPPDPSTLPENAAISVIAVGVNSAYKQPVKVNEATSVSVTFELRLPDFIDSVTADVESAEGVIEYHAVVEKPWDTAAFSVFLQFPSSGVKTLVCTAWITDGIKKTAEVIFNVASRIANAAPEFSPATIEFLSEKGRAATRNLMPYVSDPEHDNLAFEIKDEDGGPSFLLKDSLLSLAADLDVGTYVLSVTVSDGKLSDAGTIIWKVFTPPQGTSVIADDEVHTVKNTPVTIDVLENDEVPSGSQLSWCGQGKHGRTFLNDGKVHYAPEKGFVGSDTLFYVVNDADTGRVYIQVRKPSIANRPPVLAPDTIEVYSPEGVSTIANIAGYAQDPDNDALIFTVTPQENAAFVVNNAVVASLGELPENIYYLGIDVSDGQEHVHGVMKWTVFRDDGGEINPVTDMVFLKAGAVTAVDVLENDEVVSGNGELYVTSVTQGEHGTVYVRNGATVVYRSEEGVSGKDTVMYVVNTRDTGMVCITVWSGPVAIDDTLSVQEDGTGSVNVLVNDMSLPEYPLSVASVKNGTLGSATLDGDSVVAYQAKPGVSGIDTVLYVLNIGDTANLVVTITPAEIALVPDTVSVLQGRSREFMVLANDRISEGSLRITGVTESDKGTVAFTDSSVRFTAKAEAEGTTDITYSVNDGRASATVTVTILAVELTANADSVTCDEDAGAVTVDVLANDVITGGEVMTLTAAAGAKLGTVTLDGDKKRVVYTPDANRNGRDTVKYTVNDAVDGVLVVTVRPVNDMPVFTAADTAATLAEQTKGTLLFAATDVDGTPVEFSLDGAPQWVSMAGTTDSVRVIAAPGYAVVTGGGDATVEFKVRGVSGADTITKNVTVKVTDVAAVPSFEASSVSVDVKEGESKTVTFAATDPQNDPLTYSVEGVPDWITATTTGGVKLVINPGYALVTAEEAEKPFDLTLSVSDGTYSAICAVTVVVADSNSAPVFTDTVSLLAMNEGTTRTLVFRATDVQGDALTYAVSPASIGWITVSTQDSIVLKLSPGYTVATSAAPTATIALTLSVDDGSGPVTRALEVRVSNVSQKIVISSFPGTVHARMGDTLVTAAITANDPNGGTLNYTLESAPAGMTMNSTDHTIRWFVPRNNADIVVGQQVPVAVRVTNGVEYRDSTIQIIVDPHKWTLMNSGLARSADFTTRFTAVGKDTLFLMEQKGDDTSMSTNIYRSVDGGKTWPSIPYITFGGMYHGPLAIMAKGKDVFVFDAIRNSGNYITFAWNNPITTLTSTNQFVAYDVSPDGNRLMTNEEAAFSSFGPIVRYVDENVSYTKDSLYNWLKSIACGNTYIWTLDKDGGVYYLQNYSTADTYHGLQPQLTILNGTTIYCDNNNGDTAFVLNGTSAIHQFILPSSKATIPVSQTPVDIMMLSGYLGWFLGDDGKIYFSNTAFRDVAAEVLVDAYGAAAEITGMFRSSDGATVFAFSKDTDGKMMLFRY